MFYFYLDPEIDMLGSNNPVPFKIQVEKVPHHAYEFSEKDTV